MTDKCNPTSLTDKDNVPSESSAETFHEIRQLDPKNELGSQLRGRIHQTKPNRVHPLEPSETTKRFEFKYG